MRNRGNPKWEFEKGENETICLTNQNFSDKRGENENTSIEFHIIKGRRISPDCKISQGFVGNTLK